jgi:hypothetical protein
MRKRDKEFPVSKLDLARKAYEPEVKRALERWLEIEASGGDPIGSWSQQNGYRIVDQNEWYKLLRQLRS